MFTTTYFVYDLATVNLSLILCYNLCLMFVYWSLVDKVFFSTKLALRGEAALKARLPKEAKKNAAISPYDRSLTESNWGAAFHSQIVEQSPPFVGELLQVTQKGNFP